MPGFVVSRSRLVGLKVYTSTARYVGEIRDIGFSLGEKQEIHLVIAAPGGGEIEIPASKIAAIGDIVILVKDYTPPEPATRQPGSTAQQQSFSPGPTVSVAVAEPRPGPSTSMEPPIPRCPTCGHAVIYYPKKRKWYCPHCRKYVKPVPPGVEERVPRCPKCGNPLSYIEQYGKWYCYNCNEYVEVRV